MTLRLMIHQPLAADATAVKPHHLGVGGSLIDEHQRGRIKQTLFAHPASACPRYVRALLLRRAQAFLRNGNGGRWLYGLEHEAEGLRSPMQGVYYSRAVS